MLRKMLLPTERETKITEADRALIAASLANVPLAAPANQPKTSGSSSRRRRKGKAKQAQGPPSGSGLISGQRAKHISDVTLA